MTEKITLIPTSFKVVNVITVFKYLLGIFCLFLIACQNEHCENSNDVFCDAEHVITKDNLLFFESCNTVFFGGGTRSDEQAYSGKYSSKLTPKKRFGMTYECADLKPGSVIEATIWALGQSDSVFLVAQGKQGFYKQSQKIINTSNGWSQLHLKVVVPDPAAAPIKFYPWNRSQIDSTYFDDLRITQSSYKSYAANLFPDTISFFNISLDPNAIKKVRSKRNQALSQLLPNGKGILIKGNEDWVEGEIDSLGIPISAKLRLKGDWTDHISSRKWSYRIKLYNNSYRGMKEFSIQSPNTRGFLGEWMFHKMLNDEGLLTPEYFFEFVSVNDSLLGLYAFEEHFNQNMLKRNKRKEGLILKFDENPMWAARKVYKAELSASFPFMEASKIKAHSKRKIMYSDSLKVQFKKAQELMYNYQFGLSAPSEVFNLDKLAKFYAIVDLSQAYHCLFWHNQKWYYNPDVNRLEPIGYDGHGEYGVFQIHSGDYLGHKQSGFKLVDRLLKDEALHKKYIQYLKQFSSRDFIEQFSSKHENEMNASLRKIKIELPAFHYDFDHLKQRARHIRELLSSQEGSFLEREEMTLIQTPDFYAQHFKASGYCCPLNGGSIKAHRVNNGELMVSSFHHEPVQLIGFGNTEAVLDTCSFRIPPTKSWPPPKYVFKTEEGNTVIHYTVDCTERKLYIVASDEHIPYEDQNNIHIRRGR